ncbi:MAG: hypothetical protein Q7U08_07040 [Flavobacteriaceae bacterium]|nr:hypothetical protein [Flavobacteriaceae bacterium]
MFDDTYFPNVLTLCGSGRNVGKTHMGCQIIKHFSQFNQVIAIKISKFKHQHSENEGMYRVYKSDGFQIWKQLNYTEKDSGRYLSAGASTSYYIECDDKHLLEAFLFIYKIYGNSCLIVCESASISKYINPAITVFIKSTTYLTNDNKLHFLNLSNLVLKERSEEISNPQLVISSVSTNWIKIQWNMQIEIG